MTVLILLVLTAIVFLQIILRNFFGTGFVWVEELSRFLLLSMVLIAAPLVFLKGGHVKFDLLYRSVLSRKGQRIYSVFLVLLVMFFYAVYLVSHFQLMKTSGNVKSPSLNIPNTYFFLSGLIGALLGIAAGITRIYKIIRKQDK